MTQTTPIYMQFSDDGQNLRKWSFKPFDGAYQFAGSPPPIDNNLLGRLKAARKVYSNEYTTVRNDVLDEVLAALQAPLPIASDPLADDVVERTARAIVRDRVTPFLPPEFVEKTVEMCWSTVVGDAKAALIAAEALAANPLQTADDLTRDLSHALELALKYWTDRQQRYKNRSPVWVQEARAALAKLKASPPSNKTPTVPLDEQGALALLKAECIRPFVIDEPAEDLLDLSDAQMGCILRAIIQASKGPTT